jgi:hypothetical protein
MKLHMTSEGPACYRIYRDTLWIATAYSKAFADLIVERCGDKPNPQKKRKAVRRGK